MRNEQNSKRMMRNLLRLKDLIFTILTILLMNSGIFAEGENQLTLPSLMEVEVTGVRNTKPPFEAKAGIGDRIEVDVKNLEKLIQYAKCKSVDDKTVIGCLPQNIVLFLDGREIKGLLPDSGAPQPDPGTLQFNLERKKDADPDKDNDKAWADLLGGPKFGEKFFVRQTALSIGFQNGYPLASKIKSGGNSEVKFELIRVRKHWFYTCSILLFIILGALWFLGWHTELLRSVGTPPNFNETTGKANSVGSYKFFGLKKYEHKPYSLGQFQMAFWFSLVILAFLYIWLVNGASDTITVSTLGLIGIGAGTALGAAAIDFGKHQGDKTELANLEAEEASLQIAIATLNGGINPPAGTTARDAAVLAQLVAERDTKQSRFNLITKRIPQLKKSLEPKKSNWFLMDVLTDQGTGISFHRFQMFVWTLILGILFVFQVWYRLSMPEFDTTLLALLGISSGTYLGFKIPERQH